MDSPYHRSLLGKDCPRRGDIAAIVRDHHHTETGLVVHVVNDPHRCTQICHECGQEVTEFFVEVESQTWPREAGPYFYPIRWLKRVLPV
ncbi:MAG: hypothetical protein V4457_05940 [Pseudomonadota bacterium]